MLMKFVESAANMLADIATEALVDVGPCFQGWEQGGTNRNRTVV
jgi:hypothetical protein